MSTIERIHREKGLGTDIGIGLREQGQVRENTEVVTPGRLGSGPGGSWRGEEVCAGNSVLLALARRAASPA